MAQLRCCCGRSECAYLRHNHAAMEGLEKDLRSAAQIGQVGESFNDNTGACNIPQPHNPWHIFLGQAQL